MEPVRTFDGRAFDAAELVTLKRGRRISVCLPARDEEATIGPIVERTRHALVLECPLVDDIVVVDDRSADDTARIAGAAGARVVRTGEGHGKGAALRTATAVAEGELLVFCDADLRDFDPAFVVGLLGPLLLHDDVALVKAFYARPIDGRAPGGGRVTELVARPLLAMLFPELGAIAQPLAGEYAARRGVLERVRFVEGYGVDVALLIDVAAGWGASALAQVDLGVRAHRNRPLDELGPMAAEVAQAILRRAGVGAADAPVVLAAPGRPPVVVAPRELPPLGPSPHAAGRGRRTA